MLEHYNNIFTGTMQERKMCLTYIICGFYLLLTAYNLIVRTNNVLIASLRDIFIANKIVLNILWQFYYISKIDFTQLVNLKKIFFCTLCNSEESQDTELNNHLPGKYLHSKKMQCSLQLLGSVCFLMISSKRKISD